MRWVSAGEIERGGDGPVRLGNAQRAGVRRPMRVSTVGRIEPMSGEGSGEGGADGGAKPGGGKGLWGSGALIPPCAEAGGSGIATSVEDAGGEAEDGVEARPPLTAPGGAPGRSGAATSSSSRCSSTAGSTATTSGSPSSAAAAPTAMRRRSRFGWGIWPGGRPWPGVVARGSGGGRRGCRGREPTVERSRGGTPSSRALRRRRWPRSTRRSWRARGRGSPWHRRGDSSNRRRGGRAS